MNRVHVLLFLLLFLPSIGKSQVAITSDPDLAWFKPELVVSNDQICETLYQDAITKFFTAAPLRNLYYPQRNSEPDFLGMQALSLYDPTITPERGAIASLTIDGNQIFLQSYTYRGCGGACESYQLLSSDSPTFERGNPNSLPISSPYGFQLYQDQFGTYWTLVLDGEDRRLYLYKVPADGLWTTACEVHFKPENLSQVETPDLQRVLQSVEQLRLRVESMLGSEGTCGTSRTLTRWTNSLRQRLPELLYQPWRRALADPRSEPYTSDLTNLEDWSLFGISEFNAFQAYLAQLEQTVDLLAEFYVREYGWSETESEQLAYEAATNTIGESIRFYNFGAFSDEESAVRQAILTGMPLESFRVLPFDFSQDSGRRHAEKIVSLAINSPDLLQYILAEGGDANSENDFGKTPLMYAAQNNNLEAARILLAAGANPNAITRRSTDSCYYSLSTTNMTPLHYAVRYASPDLIRLLLDEGAAPFINSEGFRGTTNPLDWLRIYTARTSSEINPNIPEGMIEQVAVWLEPPTPEALVRRVPALVLEAEELYQSGEIATAYQRIALALQIDPDNERALSDMSLIALRNQKLGSALEASQKLIDGPYSDRMKANAWFNQGLACEAHGRVMFSYNGSYHCRLGSLFSFQRALSLENTDARKNKILQLFDSHTVPYCQIPGNNGEELKLNFQLGSDPEADRYTQVSMFTVLHSRERDVQPELLAWNQRFSDGERTITPERVSELDLGEKVLSVFRAEQYHSFPFRFGNYICETADDSDATASL